MGGFRLNAKLRFLKALSDETRARILLYLLDKDRTVGEIVEKCGRAQPTVSLNLKVLENCGIVAGRKQGKFVYYHIEDRQRPLVISAFGLRR